MAKTINRDAGLIILGTYNLLLSLASLRSALTGEVSERLAAQQALLRHSISDQRLRELKDKLGALPSFRTLLIHPVDESTQYSRFRPLMTSSMRQGPNRPMQLVPRSVCFFLACRQPRPKRYASGGVYP